MEIYSDKGPDYFLLSLPPGAQAWKALPKSSPPLFTFVNFPILLLKLIRFVSLRCSHCEAAPYFLSSDS